MLVADAFVWCGECDKLTYQVLMFTRRGGADEYECMKGHENIIQMRWEPVQKIERILADDFPTREDCMRSPIKLDEFEHEVAI